MTGRVTESAPTTTTPIGGATVTIADGANAGKSTTTDSGGNFSLASLTAGGFTVNVSAPGYQARGIGVSLTTSSTQAFSLSPNAQTLTETFTGSISGGDARCTGGDGTFTDKACKVITLHVHNPGNLVATLDWSPSGSAADLDLSLFRAGTTTAIVRSTGVTSQETVSTSLTAGFDYELHVTYYAGSSITAYTLRVTHPN
jgi:hypothetical protein